MRALIVYGSPRHKKSASYHVGYNFAEGLKRAGAEVDEIMVCKQKINHCQGCFTCWTKTPGVCIHKDDMVENLYKMQEADLIVFATPLYIFHVPGILKDFLDRSIPLAQPFLIERDGITSHPARDSSKKRRIFLISVAGFPELSHFDALVLAFKKTYGPKGYIGEILIGGAEIMSKDEYQSAYESLYALIEQAGFELIKYGSISEETLKKITEKTQFSKEQIKNLREKGNIYWESLQPKDYSNIRIEEPEVEPLKVTDKGMAPFFAGMASQYNSSVISNLKFILQFNLDENHYYLIIQGDNCKAYEGIHPNPTLTITAPTNIWMKISTGEISGTKAFMEGLYEVEGDMSILLQMEKLFSAKAN